MIDLLVTDHFDYKNGGFPLESSKSLKSRKNHHFLPSPYSWFLVDFRASSRTMGTISVPHSYTAYRTYLVCLLGYQPGFTSNKTYHCQVNLMQFWPCSRRMHMRIMAAANPAALFPNTELPYPCVDEHVFDNDGPFASSSQKDCWKWYEQALPTSATVWPCARVGMCLTILLKPCQVTLTSQIPLMSALVPLVAGVTMT
jgi:hypothetical protein